MRWCRVRRSLQRTACGAISAALLLALSMGGVRADPAADALARLDALSRQAVQSRAAVTAAQRDVEAKRAAQTAAEDRLRGDLGALEGANARLQVSQGAVDRVAGMTYVSGHTGQLAAVLSAASPQQLIDQLSLQRAVAAEVTGQLKAFESDRARAAAAAQASEKSAADARAAADRSAEVRADLQAKWGDLQRQILAAEAQYSALTPQQQAVIDTAAATLPPVQGAPAPGAAPPAAAPVVIPDALRPGVASEAGLQPNTVLAARAVSATFPQIAEIDGVRPDSKPWHPSGLAIDIMIPNPSSPEGIALGDQILAFAMSNAARFGLQDVIWRGTYYTPAGPQASGYGHYDHVHITTTPRR